MTKLRAKRIYGSRLCCGNNTHAGVAHTSAVLYSALKPHHHMHNATAGLQQLDNRCAIKYAAVVYTCQRQLRKYTYTTTLCTRTYIQTQCWLQRKQISILCRRRARVAPDDNKQPTNPDMQQQYRQGTYEPSGCCCHCLNLHLLLSTRRGTSRCSSGTGFRG